MTQQPHTTAVSDRLEVLSPSAKLVYYVLSHKAPLTQDQITEETMLAGRTARYALEQLEEAELVTSELYIPDARKREYWPAADADP
jgi:DNA-binding transcriptional ArsR family regulator